MKELVEVIAKSLVTHPESVEVGVRVKGDLEIYELSVHADDKGKVIGRQGRIANAIRSVVKAGAIKSKKKVTVDIV